MAHGQCNCGAVSFTVTTELSDVIVCHCSFCRRATGSNGIADDGRRHLEAFEG